MSPVAIEMQQMELPIAVLLRRRAGEAPYERVRSDALPEHTRYRDDGCDIHPHCLTCPLPRCRYDEPGGLRGLLNSYRDRQIVEMRLSGAPVEELAERFGVSRRTIFRILEMNQRNAKPRLEVRCA